ncbi:N-acetyl-gamma-glutamyl-phosphate reductase [Carboxydochorda subterranea]|uniref:N-acetyl-gamma-glutamyl-phosphate reductase n=1 Tax=Carboxydichorda subterranea TaxID=3109565 RepID=A0ABZ1BUU1_9FIRM|nr:N-acetyl-gamma-glutamyl-phosphate reductase [Limnochorda sp. L945t]WRP16418.1 N-acetyl-gamma-glutamyl-phosphate reductase [Limnochorda sp. L945t]
MGGVSHPRSRRVSAGIVGGSGYSALELLRLLARHPRLELKWIFSRSHTGEPVASVYPSLRGVVSASFAPVEEPAALAGQADVVFFATPAGVAAEQAPLFLESGAAVVDLSADFRFRDEETYRRVYGKSHPHPEWLASSVYGIPELFRDELAHARLVGNPGCYPTAALLALAPLAREALLDPDAPIVVSATSGISGAGSQPGPAYHFPGATENVRPYGVPGHRHAPEMAAVLGRLVPPGKSAPVLTFIPHLVPASRGILATCVARPAREMPDEELLERYRRFYASHPWVRVLEPPELPQTKAVQGSNFCDLAIRWDPVAGVVVAMAAIDNLVKGAAGQAVQNVNVLMGWDEREGLEVVPLYP